ncbi:MAG TPA: magnesium citrate secondary transporter [Bacteroidia bacterium]|nr:magnesium citrate secondary transporter [Bacteroidia bacterium]
MEKQFGIFIPLIHAYLDDLLCMPVVLSITLHILRLVLKNEKYVFSKIQVFFAVIYFSVMFEGILPLFSVNHTSDIMDIAAYGTGAIIFFKHMNIKQLKLGIQ